MLIKFDENFFFLGKKWHHLLGETVGNSCSTGPGSKQSTCSDEVERVLRLKSMVNGPVDFISCGCFTPSQLVRSPHGEGL